MVKTKKQMFIIVGVFLVALMLFTTTYAFFNYTRTGAANIIKTGRIYFNSEQGTSINLENLFPIDSENTVDMNDPEKVGTVTINVVGDTTYTDGIEYLVSAVNVNNSISTKHLPISISVAVENNSGNDPETNLGTLDTDYFTNRGSSAQSSIYNVLASNTIHEGDKLLVGYIKSGATGVDGNIVIKAYIDKDKIAISDTYTEGDRYSVITGLSNETIANCVSHLESIDYDDNLLTGETLSDFCSGTGTIDGNTFQETLDRGAFNSTSLTYFVNNNIIRYLGHDGTTDEWVDEREVFTTREWNALKTSGVSFQVKVEANEGIWVDDGSPKTIPTCPDCMFMYTTNDYIYGGSAAATNIQDITETVTNDYTTLITDERKVFIGFTELNGKIDRAFACGIKDSDPNNGTPYCVEGKLGTTLGGQAEDIAASYSANVGILTSLYGDTYDDLNEIGCKVDSSDTVCRGGTGKVASHVYDGGTVGVYNSVSNCSIDEFASLSCEES